MKATAKWHEEGGSKESVPTGAIASVRATDAATRGKVLRGLDLHRLGSTSEFKPKGPVGLGEQSYGAEGSP